MMYVYRGTGGKIDLLERLVYIYDRSTSSTL